MKKLISRFLFFFLIGFSANGSANVITLSIDSLNQSMQVISASACDTIIILNNSGYTDYYFTDTTVFGSGDFNLEIFPDTLIGQWGSGVSFFYNINGFDNLVVSHQDHRAYYFINIIPCSIINSINTIENLIEMYPNPAQDNLFVKTIGVGISLEILNQVGSSLITVIPNDETTFIDVSLLSNALYFLKVTNKNGKVFYKRFYKSI